MREQLIAALGLEFDLTAEEIADILWLALQQQSNESFSSSQSSSNKQPVASTPLVNLSVILNTPILLPIPHLLNPL